MTKKQKKAAITAVICGIIFLLVCIVTVFIVAKKLKSTKTESGDASTVEAGEISTELATGAILPETDDAGSDYVAQTLFIGDSNTVRMNKNALISLQQYCAEEGLNVQQAVSKQIVAFENDSNLYTIPQAVAMLKPRRVLITLGTNDCAEGESVEDFVQNYRALIEAIQQSYSYCDIIVNAVPPVPEAHSKYPDVNEETIDAYNAALSGLCEEMGVSFLNSTVALTGDDGYAITSMFADNDVHFTLSGLNTLFDYYRTHALETEDARPEADRNAVLPVRVQNVGDEPEATEEPTPTPTASAQALYTATYYVDSKSGGGTLSSGDEKDKTSLTIKITDASQSVTVKATPKDGYKFVKWSDGVTTAERTDKNFKQNINVTAVFEKVENTLSLTIKQTSSGSVTVGGKASFSVTVSGKYNGEEVKADSISWYTEGTKSGWSSTKGSTYSKTFSEAGEYTISAAYMVDGNVIARSNKIKITVTAAATAAPTATPAPTATTAPTATPTTAPTATPETEPTATPEGTSDPENNEDNNTNG